MTLLESTIDKIGEYNPALRESFDEILRALASTAGILGISIVLILKCMSIPWWGILPMVLVCIILGHAIDKHLGQRDVAWSKLGKEFVELSLLVAAADKNRSEKEILEISNILQNEYSWDKASADHTVKNRIAAIDITRDISTKLIESKCHSFKEKTKRHADFRIVMLMLLRQVSGADKRLDISELEQLHAIADCLNIKKEISEALIAHNPHSHTHGEGSL